MSEGNLVQFHVSDEGEIRSFVGKIGEIAVLRGIPSNCPLWVVLDLCGTTSKVEFISSRESPLAISMRLLQRNCGLALRGIMSRVNERNPHVEGFLSVFGGKSRSNTGNRESLTSVRTNEGRTAEQSPTLRNDTIQAAADAPSLYDSSVPTAPPESPPLPRRMASPLPPPPSRNSLVQENRSECYICFDAAINSVFIDCGHMCACIECAQKIKNETNKCPICRRVIKQACKTFKT
ncbi:hypothetical protein PMAYCL1PPCAC_28928 [Pristionchus mayeri]|uniref:Zinc finger protein n=1 Tax=Pristionchus mayeri TaxID=1317129 RepID=A0AAN5D8Z9_9BILA|nr:hypothetical protein PMAYCL1PPCAC_28928 [Pristionchus mayeri]